MRVFRALTEEGSMTGAAKRLNITQPAISATLAQLERELGFVVFHRSRKGLTLTTRGVSLLDKVRSLLAMAQEIQDFGKSARDDEGVLRVAGRQGFMQYVFPKLVSALHEHAPRIRIEQCLSGNASDVVEALKLGHADLAFAAAPGIKSIASEVLVKDPVWLAVSANHPLANRRRVSIAQLKGITLCLPMPGDRLRKPIERFLKRLPAPPSILLETNDYTLMKHLIELGECAGFIYAHMLLGEPQGSVVPLVLDDLDLTRDLTILHRRDDIEPHVMLARELFVIESRRLLGRSHDRFLKPSARRRTTE